MQASVEVTTPSDREVTVTRIFNAPAQVIFDCHTRADYVQRWLTGPPGWSMPVCEIDLRVGGHYRYVWRDSASGTEFGCRGEFNEIAAPGRIVHTETMDGAEGAALCTLTLVESDGRTTLRMNMVFPSQATRDQALQSGMTDGMSGSYNQLEAFMAEAKGA
jgi:uncharacterized protein YndB with AHSA1/START domain